MNSKTQRSLAHPYYWPAWCLIGIIWLLVKLLPYAILMRIGKHLGRLILLFDKKGCRTTQTNINLCFPELSVAEKKQFLKKNYASLGMAIFESGLAWWGSDKKLKKLAHFHGVEHLKAAEAAGTGVVMLGIHFFTLELCGRLFALHGYDFAVVYRAHKKPFMNALLTASRERQFPHAIERSNVRGLLKALKKGKTVWYTPDIDAGYYDHIFVPFFGIPAATLTAPSRLAKITSAKTLLSSYYRRDDLSGYDIIFSPPFEDFPSDHIEKDISCVNRAIEEAIRIKPEQYIWQYKRFKTRPNEESRFYGRSL